MNNSPKALRVTKTLHPGQAGTLKLHRHYGEALLAVRYREDIAGATRYTTVELIVEQSPAQRRRMSDRTLVFVQIPWDQALIRERAPALGAKWDHKTKQWAMSLRVAKALALTDHIRPKADHKQP